MLYWLNKAASQGDPYAINMLMVFKAEHVSDSSQ